MALVLCGLSDGRRPAPATLVDTTVVDTRAEQAEADQLWAAQWPGHALGLQVAGRTYAMLGRLSPEDSDRVYSCAGERFQTGSAGWTDSVRRGIRRRGVVPIRPGVRAAYETCVRRGLTDARDRKRVARLPRPWPLWSPPLRWEDSVPNIGRGVLID